MEKIDMKNSYFHIIGMWDESYRCSSRLNSILKTGYIMCRKSLAQNYLGARNGDASYQEDDEVCITFNSSFKDNFTKLSIENTIAKSKGFIWSQENYYHFTIILNNLLLQDFEVHIPDSDIVDELRIVGDIPISKYALGIIGQQIYNYELNAFRYYLLFKTEKISRSDLLTSIQALYYNNYYICQKYPFNNLDELEYFLNDAVYPFLKSSFSQAFQRLNNTQKNDILRDILAKNHSKLPIIQPFNGEIYTTPKKEMENILDLQNQFQKMKKFTLN